MASLADANVLVQARLRAILARAVAAVWTGLGSYDRENVDEWLTTVLPLVEAAQRKSVALTDAYLARALDRPPIGINPTMLVGAAVRNGTPPAEVYHRPFVQLWSALGNGTAYEDAVAQGLHRAESAAGTDVQLSMRGAAVAVAEADDRIVGWQRVTDGNACVLCQIASTQRYHREGLLPIHAHCGCSVAPVTGESSRVVNRDLFRTLKAEGAMDAITRSRQATGFRQRAEASRRRAADAREELARETDPARRDRLSERVRSWDERARAQDAQALKPPVAAVREHGEIGPVLVNADHHFQSARDF